MGAAALFAAVHTCCRRLRCCLGCSQRDREVTELRASLAERDTKLVTTR